MDAAAGLRTPNRGGVELRLEQLAADGAVALRIAAPFKWRSAPAVREGDAYVVERGNSLWVIARRIYGKGIRYTTIYSANPGLIHNPNRIYPGQTSSCRNRDPVCRKARRGKSRFGGLAAGSARVRARNATSA